MSDDELAFILELLNQYEPDTHDNMLLRDACRRWVWRQASRQPVPVIEDRPIERVELVFWLALGLAFVFVVIILVLFPWVLPQ